MLDHGSGIPIVLVPGIQGCWEWMQRAVDALATKNRVITDSFPSEPGSIASINTKRGFNSFIDWLDQLLARANVDTVALCGVSYGGWVAVHYAATRPTKISSLTLVSTPSPNWRPPCRIERYLRSPRLMAPAFIVSSPLRLYPEISVAFPSLRQRLHFGAEYLARVVTSPATPTRMTERMRLAQQVDFEADSSRIRSPTQIITGETALDRVVPVDSSREYLNTISGSTTVTIENTGHIGIATRPVRFAKMVSEHARKTISVKPLSEQVPA